VAEATKNTSLASGGGVSEENDLFLGTLRMDKTWGICPKTMDFFCDTTGELKCTDPNIVGDRTKYIIKDLVADEDLKERPYVSEWPHMRSYLEVPVTSPLGYVIGGLSVIDNKLREWDEGAVKTLTEIGETMMSHLEHVRTKNLQARSAKLIKGLDKFTQEEAGIQVQRKASTFGPQDNPHRPAHERRRSEIPNSDLDLLSISEEPASLAAPENLHQTRPTVVSNGEPKVQAFPAEVRNTFTRSAATIRASMAMDGMVFLDASSISASARNRHQSLRRASETPSNGVGSDESCPVLASSLVSTDLARPIDFSQDLLDRLANRFPRGRIFLADQYGVLSGPSTPTSSTSHIDFFEAATANDRQADVRELFAILPQATSVIFLPMWHFQKERWFAAGIGWTCDLTYSFDSSDATSLSAFGNAIMIEVLRYDAQAISKAKSDFISSISHEIRSPLHGILATAELLSDSIRASEERSMLAMIQSCGTTLLDTMNHLLEFAKINNLSQSKTKVAPGGKSGLEIIDLSRLVEDVAENVSTGFAFETNPHRQGVRAQAIVSTPTNESGPVLPVLVTLDIQTSDKWEMLLDPGAWKRVVMNLVGNALKYTPTGHICVSLSLQNDEICFAVKDTGIGIGEEYLRYNLFTPYSQENTFSSGTGLGLAIVQQIVKNIGGRLEVQSEVGAGTMVTVKVPLPPRSSSARSSATMQQLGKEFAGRRLCYAKPTISMPHTPEYLTYAQTLESSVADTASYWLGVETIGTTNVDDVLADVYVIDGTLAIHPESVVPTTLRGKPVVIIMGPHSRHQTLGRALTFLRPPFGPRQLAHAINSALESSAHVEEGDKKIMGDLRIEESQPLDVVPGGLLAEANVSPAPAVSPKSSSIHHILVVDDNAINLKIITKLLDKIGCSYATAVNGFDAVEAYKAASSLSLTSEERAFSLIFMDVSMPVMNGFDATRKIRWHEQAEGIIPVTIIALTGLGDESSEKEAFSCGMDEFWTKPVKLSKVRTLLVVKEEKT
jgi:signal transduction histidine kinase/ActR/RegA family two-component response regulator